MADEENGYRPGARLAVTLFGSLTVALDGIPVRGFVSGKSAALVYT